MTASPAYALLRAGVPLSLLLDLAEPLGPDSVEIARAERPLPALLVVGEDDDALPGARALVAPGMR